MKTNQYSGETALHAAIAKQKFALVQALLAAGADVEAEVTGTFFSKGGPCYMGGFPLSFAVATDQVEMVKILVAHDDSILQDQYGNTIMHIAVIWKKKEMHKFLLLYKPRVKEGIAKSTRGSQAAESEDVPLHTALNGKEGDALGSRRSAISITPSTNDPDMLEFLADVHGCTLWEFSNVSCKAFVVAELDAVAKSIFLDDSWDLLMVPVMHKYFKTKWELHGYKYFCIEAFLAFVYMCLYTSTVVETSLSQETTRIFESICIAPAIFHTIREANRMRLFYKLGGWPAFIYTAFLGTFSLVIWLAQGGNVDNTGDLSAFSSWGKTAETTIFITLGEFEDFQQISNFQAPRTAKIAAYDHSVDQSADCVVDGHVQHCQK
jgi:hypothetical protein